jgi:tetratricopeptide (TPR) repeat protein
MLLLVNHRPEYTHRWGNKTYYTQLRLDPLPPESAEALLDALLGSDPALRPLKHLLFERTEGNPFFLEESVRTLVETKALTGERGTYHLAHVLPSIQVPATVQAVLAARIDRLATEDKRLLQAAAVIGTDVPFAILRSIAEVPEDGVRYSLATLQASEFLHEARLFPDLEYTFKHALTHEVAYGSLLQDRRRALHARIVTAIERLYSERLAEHVERLAHHTLRGEVWEQAVLYLRRAGAKAFARSANREAVAHFEHALHALAHLPETRETTEQGIDLRLDLRTALFVLGEIRRGVELLHEADRLAQMLKDSRRLGWVSFAMSHNHFMMDESTPQRLFAERALAIAETLADRRLRVAASCLLGTAYFDSGEYRRAEEVFRTVVALLDDDLTHDPCGVHVFPAVLSRAWLARALAERGVFDQGIEYGKEAIRIAEALGHSYSVAQAIRHLAYLYTLKGEFGSAAELLQRGLEEHIPIASFILTGKLGNVYAHWGRVTEGLALLRHASQAREVMGTEGTGFYYALFLVHLGHAHMLANRLEDARASAERAMTVACERKGRGDESHALHLLGEIAAQADPPDVKTAEEHYRQALALATELGMRPLVAHCHLGLGTLYRRTSDQAKAHEHLTTAVTMYREMGMPFWLEKADAELRGVEQ